MQPSRTQVLVAAGAVATALVAYLMRPRLIDVDTAVVARGTLSVTVDEEGATRVRLRRDVHAPVSGRFVPGHVRVGDRVARGATLGLVLPAPLDAEGRRAATARADAADAVWREADARLAAAEASLREALDVLARRERLASSGVISREDLERARTAAGTLREERDAASARVAAARADAAAAHATLDVRAAATSSAVVVAAPVAGVVLRLIEEHERVLPAGTRIAEVGDPADIEVVVPLLTTDAVRIARGATVRVTTGPGSDTLLARVTLVEPAAFTKLSPLGVEEQRVNVVARFTTPVTGFGDAFRVDVRVTVAEVADALIVPSRALVRDGASWAAFVVTNGRAVRRAVTLGARSADGAEVRAGLAAGDAVVEYPPENLLDGSRVRLAAPPELPRE